jgi:hypothetical protein
VKKGKTRHPRGNDGSTTFTTKPARLPKPRTKLKTVMAIIFVTSNSHLAVNAVNATLGQASLVELPVLEQEDTTVAPPDGRVDPVAPLGAPKHQSFHEPTKLIQKWSRRKISVFNPTASKRKQSDPRRNQLLDPPEEHEV